MKQPIKIVLTGGGSGGHITPLLSLARELKHQDPDCRLFYIGLKGDSIEGLQKEYKIFDRLSYIPAGKFRRYHGETFWAHLTDIKTIWLNFRDLFRTLRGLVAAYRLLRVIKPQLVFSKGGYVVVPVGFAAKLRKLTIITHDSDTVPGLANRLIGKYAAWHATGMPPQYYSYSKDSICYTGTPTDERFQLLRSADVASYKKQIGFAPSDLVLLVEGGGLGSAKINNLLVESAARLLGASPNLRIVHICGDKHLKEVEGQYTAGLEPGLRSRITLKGFVNDLYKYSGAADLVVARAGASTLSELAMQAKAAIIIPSPFLTGGHQLKNATVLQDNNAALVLDNSVNSEDFINAASELLSNQPQRQKLANNIAGLAKPKAANDLAQLIINTIKTQTNP